MWQVQKNLAWIALAVLIFACDQSAETPQKPQRDYFPMETSQYRIYSVEEIKYILSVPETLNYDLKVVTSESFINDQGGRTFVLHRYRRSNGGEWIPDETWSAFMRQEKAIVMRGNIPYVVLEFPVEEGRKWNGNAFNLQTHFYTGEPADEYVITSIDETVELAGETFLNCAVVQQEDDEDPILYKDVRMETYAPGVGLISKQTIQLKYCSRDACLGQKQIEEGLIYNQTLVEYGQE